MLYFFISLGFIVSIIVFLLILFFLIISARNPYGIGIGVGTEMTMSIKECKKTRTKMIFIMDTAYKATVIFFLMAMALKQ